MVAVVSTTGLVDLLNGIRYLAGGGTDSLTLTDATARLSESVIVGALPGQGASVISDGATQTVYFEDIEPIMTSVVATTFTITSNPALASLLDASNSINYESSPLIGPTGGRVTVDNFEPIDFVNKTSLTIDAGAGSDSINLNNPNTPTNLTSITINGDDPTASDTVIVNGTAGNDTVGYNPSATIGAGSVTIAGAPTVNFTTTEAVKFNGQGGADTLTINTPAGGNNNTFTPGASYDSGTVSFRQFGAGTALVPLEFSHIGALGGVTFAGSGAGTDILEVNGTSNSDTFNVTGSTVQIINATAGFTTVLLQTPGIFDMALRGLDGDDTFNLTGSLAPLLNIVVDGGNPDAGSDVLNFIGAGAGAITVDLTAGTVQQAGSAAVTYIGTENLNITAGGAAISITGTCAVGPTAASSPWNNGQTAAPGGAIAGNCGGGMIII